MTLESVQLLYDDTQSTRYGAKQQSAFFFFFSQIVNSLCHTTPFPFSHVTQFADKCRSTKFYGKQKKMSPELGSGSPGELIWAPSTWWLTASFPRS